MFFLLQALNITIHTYIEFFSIDLTHKFEFSNKLKITKKCFILVFDMSKEQLLVYPFYEIRLFEALVKTERNLQDSKKTKCRVLSMFCLDKPVQPNSQSLLNTNMFWEDHSCFKWGDTTVTVRKSKLLSKH